MSNIVMPGTVLGNWKVFSVETIVGERQYWLYRTDDANCWKRCMASDIEAQYEALKARRARANERRREKNKGHK